MPHFYPQNGYKCHLFSGSPLRMDSSLSQESRGIQESGQVAWQPSLAQPPLLLSADPTLPVGTSRSQQKGNRPRRVSCHTCYGSTYPILTTPNPPSPADLQRRK